MLLEYEEIISEKFNHQVARDVSRALLMLFNVFQVNIYYEWNLIETDPDDNKFVDCAVSANVDYLVTNDKHFSVLEKIEFPKIEVINVSEFKKLFAKSST
jgi:predicted nucleic acid-binding protein